MKLLAHSKGNNPKETIQQVIGEKKLPGILGNNEVSVSDITDHLSIQNVLEGIQISVHERENKIDLIAALCILIQDLQSFIKPKEEYSLSTKQEIKECAKLITQRFWYLKFEEVILAFYKVKTGEIKLESNWRFSAHTVLEIIDRWDRSEEKSEFYESRSEAYKKEESESASGKTEFYCRALGIEPVRDADNNINEEATWKLIQKQFSSNSKPHESPLK